MKKGFNMLILIAVLATMAACGANDGAESGQSFEEAAQSGVELSQDAGSDDAVVAREQLRENFSDSALPPASQLVLGTLMLDDTDLAVDPELAEFLLPYWKLYNSLLASDTTAPEELAALIEEIQEVMDPEQVNYIASLELTQEDLLAYMQESGIMQDLRPEGVDGVDGGGTRPGRPDGMPEGTGPGGGQGGGPGAGVDGLDPELMATMQAEREAAGGGLRGANRMITPLIEALIELLESKIN